MKSIKFLYHHVHHYKSQIQSKTIIFRSIIITIFFAFLEFFLWPI